MEDHSETAEVELLAGLVARRRELTVELRWIDDAIAALEPLHHHVAALRWMSDDDWNDWLSEHPELR